MTGGRRGRCVTDDAQIARTAETGPGQGVFFGRGMGYGRGAGPGRGGRGRRNQYYATGLTGWQRDQMAAAATPDTDRLEGIEAKLTEALDRLSRLEGAE